MTEKLFLDQDGRECDKPTRPVMYEVTESFCYILMVFLSLYVCFELLCYFLSVSLSMMCQRISRDGEISCLYTEWQRRDKNDEI